MKKNLAGSTALVAAAVVAGQAQAAEPIQIKIGGFMEQWVGYADSDNANKGSSTEYASVRQQSDTELYFRGSTVLDNGLKVSVVMDKEADRNSSGSGRSFDDVYLEVESKTLGEIRLGGTKGFGLKTFIGAPDVGISLGDTYDWVESEVDSIERDNAFDDGQKIYYATPSFNGLTLGASYGTVAATGSSGAINLGVNSTSSAQLSSTQNGNVTTNITDRRREVETTFGLGYSGEFSGVGVDFGAGYIETTDEENSISDYDDEEEYHVGLSVSYAGLTVAGGYTEVENIGLVKNRDADVWDIGVSYTFDQYAVSASYSSSEYDAAANDSRTDEYEVIMVSGSYNFGAGVVAHVSAFDVDESDALSNPTAENDGFGVVAGFSVGF